MSIVLLDESIPIFLIPFGFLSFTAFGELFRLAWQGTPPFGLVELTAFGEIAVELMNIPRVVPSTLACVVEVPPANEPEMVPPVTAKPAPLLPIDASVIVLSLTFAPLALYLMNALYRAVLGDDGATKFAHVAGSVVPGWAGSVTKVTFKPVTGAVLVPSVTVPEHETVLVLLETKTGPFDANVVFGIARTRGSGSDW
ncbi:MAG: hypothetical protein ACXWAY_17525 [Acidimicrobiia bacterium]